jgi:CHAT domain-containing protein
VFSTLRKDIRQLPKDTQKAYAESIASAYRGLADILLKQERILEAQQVLDLLKVQELEDYLRNTRSSKTPELTILKPEAEILKRYGELQASAIKLGDRAFTFAAIPFTLQEVGTLKSLLPTKALEGKAFDRKALLPQLNSHNIVHLATHGKFVTGDSDRSFIALGSGEIITLPEIQNLSMNNVDLVVLSACETGVGDLLGNGQEILGLGYQFQRAGARATVASLWPVDDGGAIDDGLLPGTKAGHAQGPGLASGSAVPD